LYAPLRMAGDGCEAGGSGGATGTHRQPPVANLIFPGFIEKGQHLMRDAYGENCGRLVTLKDRCDPTNLFSLNQNIEPTS
jgi:hypothetical protein